MHTECFDWLSCEERATSFAFSALPGTLVAAVCHVQFSHSHPPSSDSTTRPGHVSSQSYGIVVDVGGGGGGGCWGLSVRRIGEQPGLDVVVVLGAHNCW